MDKSRQIGDAAILVLQAVEHLESFRSLVQQAGAKLAAIEGTEELRVTNQAGEEQDFATTVKIANGLPNIQPATGMVAACLMLAADICGLAASQQQREKLEKQLCGSSPLDSSQS